MGFGLLGRDFLVSFLREKRECEQHMLEPTVGVFFLTTFSRSESCDVSDFLLTGKLLQVGPLNSNRL